MRDPDDMRDALMHDDLPVGAPAVRRHVRARAGLAPYLPDAEASDEELLLEGAQKLWPDVVRLHPRGACDGAQRWIAITADGNLVASCWVDPEDYLPVYKPTGSTPR